MGESLIMYNNTCSMNGCSFFSVECWSNPIYVIISFQITNVLCVYVTDHPVPVCSDASVPPACSLQADPPSRSQDTEHSAK